jgi:hypothetical protein
MTTILERLDRMERDLSRLNNEVLDLRAASPSAPCSSSPASSPSGCPRRLQARDHRMIL